VLETGFKLGRIVASAHRPIPLRFSIL
jgi:hypothetical protein